MNQYDMERGANEAAGEARSRRMFELFRQVSPDFKAPTWQCPGCGEQLARDEYFWRYHTATFCRCGKEAWDTAYAAYKRAHRPEVVSSLLSAAGIPRRFANASFANFQKRPGAVEPLAACQRYVTDFGRGGVSTGLFFSGGFGAGKTHLAVATICALAEEHLADVYFATTGALLERLKSSDFDWSEVERATSASVLVLDDLAQDGLSTYDRGVLFNMVNDRYTAMRITFFTSNASEKSLIEMVGGALYSRICEMAELVPVKASDYRRRSA